MPTASFMVRFFSVGAIIAAVSIAVLLVHPRTGEESTAAQPARPVAPTFVTTYWVEQVAAKVLPSVVTLQISQGAQSLLGSGVVLTADGLIMTNNHVVAGLGAAPNAPTRALATFNDGRTAVIRLVAGDPSSDIAVLRADNVSGLAPISMGSSAKLLVGQLVAAVGSPLGLQGTVTSGIISALHRLVCPATENREPSAFYAIQTDAAINPGNSGGALVDMNGDLVGMNAAESAVGSAEESDNSKHGSIGLGFAIPVDHAARIASELIATGRASHAWLGAQLSADANPYGARVIGLESDSPAATAGLTAGATITKLGDQPIVSGESLRAAVQSAEPGDGATLEFIDRSGGSRTAHITLGTDRGRQ